MLNSNQTYKCKICGKKFLISQKSSHNLVCKQAPNNINKDSPPKISKKQLSKSRDGINTSPINNIRFSLEVSNQNMFSASLNLNISRDDSINYNPDDAINDEGIMNFRNISSNFSVQQNILINNNILNINSVFETVFGIYQPVDEDILNNLIVLEKKDPEVLSDSICIVCLDNYLLGDRYIILPCVHNYHEECIKKWLRLRNKCPTCNYKITPENILNAIGNNNL